MGLQFTPGAQQVQPTTEIEATATVAGVRSDQAMVAKIEEVKNFNIVVKTDEIKQKLATSAEIDALVSTINVNDSNTIVKFGAEAAEQISQASDQVLNSMSILRNLAAIMDQFDIKELEADDKPTFFGNLKKKLDKILNKYDTMGKEIDKIYVQLKQYESEIEAANTKLDNMYDANIGYYQELVKYIMAGEQAVKELDIFIDQYQKKVAENPDDGTIQPSADEGDPRPESHGSKGCGKCGAPDRSHAQNHGVLKSQSCAQDKFSVYHNHACVQAVPRAGYNAQAAAYSGGIPQGA